MSMTTRTSSPGSRGAAVGFADARAAADRAETVQRTQAARTVLGNAIDATDCRELLNMLGLPDPERNTTARPAIPTPSYQVE